MDWICRDLAGASLGDESFSDLDYADEVTLFAEILGVLIMSLEIM